MEKEAKQIIDLKRNLFKIDVRAQKDEEKVFMRTAWSGCRSVDKPLAKGLHIKTSFYPVYALTKEISGDLQPD
nr:hypothetical protein [Streptococcus dysgalactiae]